MGYGSPPPAARDDDGTADARDRLLTAIAYLREEQARVSQLESAIDRATQQSWQTPHRVAAAAAELRRVRSEEQSRLAYEFASSADGLSALSPISAAQRQLEQARAEDERLTRVRNALEAEVVTVNNRVQRCQAGVNEALADLVIDSKAFKQLFVEQEKAFARVRGIRKAFQLIQSSLSGFMPQPIADKWQVTVPLDPEAKYFAGGDAGPIPIPTDETFAQKWSLAISALLEDPDAELPK